MRRCCVFVKKYDKYNGTFTRVSGIVSISSVPLWCPLKTALRKVWNKLLLLKQSCQKAIFYVETSKFAFGMPWIKTKDLNVKGPFIIICLEKYSYRHLYLPSNPPFRFSCKSWIKTFLNKAFKRKGLTSPLNKLT